MQPGEEVPRHTHDYEEAYFIVQGRGEMYLEGHDPIRLEPGLSVYVAAGEVHGQINDGEERLDIVCSLSPPPGEGREPVIVES